MTSIFELQAASEVSQAVHSNLSGVGAITPSSLQFSANGGLNMSLAQREDFAARYTVERLFSDSLTGAYAAVFKEKLTGKTTLAIRGTDLSLVNPDWLSNAFVLTGIPPSRNPQFIALRPVVAQWIQSGVFAPGSAITGLSLGGHLAAALKAASPTTFTQALTFNAPGFAQPLGSLAFNLQLIFGMPVPEAGVIDVRGTSGLSLIAGLGNHLGSWGPLSGSDPHPILSRNTAGRQRLTFERRVLPQLIHILRHTCPLALKEVLHRTREACVGQPVR
jgi:hypothetical protein